MRYHFDLVHSSPIIGAKHGSLYLRTMWKAKSQFFGYNLKLMEKQ